MQGTGSKWGDSAGFWRQNIQVQIQTGHALHRRTLIKGMSWDPDSLGSNHCVLN